MSYCRQGRVDGENSDLYIIRDVDGYRCVDCLQDPWTISRVDMLRHVFDHIEQGDDVPRRVVIRLCQEIMKTGDLDNTPWQLPQKN